MTSLEKEIAAHATELVRNQWDNICDQLQGNLGMKKKWQLLKHLIDPNLSKIEQKNRLTQVIHKYPGSDTEILNKVRDTYLSPSPTSPKLPNYTGLQNSDMDRDISETEVRAAIAKLRTNSAPGPDGVTNKALRNLDDKSIASLTRYMNECWRSGTIPRSWKHAKVVLIPKPNKPLSLEHLHPISLTSCLGKLMEHIIHTRLTNHVIDTEQFPHTMIGFRAGLS